MRNALEITLYASMLATLVVLILGIVQLFRKDKKNIDKSNQLMRLRVIFQGVALGILALLLLTRK